MKGWVGIWERLSSPNGIYLYCLSRLGESLARGRWIARWPKMSMVLLGRMRPLTIGCASSPPMVFGIQKKGPAASPVGEAPMPTPGGRAAVGVTRDAKK